MESFTVVDSMPMITVEAEDATQPAAHIVVKNVVNGDSSDCLAAEKSEDAGDPLDTDGMARIISGGGHIIANGRDEGHTTTQIIATADGTQIFTSESGHMMASDTGQLISAEHNIFSDSGSDIITGGSGHIIMDSDGSEKAHIVSADGDVIAVDSSLLDGTHTLPTHVSEVRVGGMREVMGICKTIMVFSELIWLTRFGLEYP